MLGLPVSTEYNRIIEPAKFLTGIKNTSYMRSVFNEQISCVTWTNKISDGTCGMLPGKHFPEMEVLKIELKNNALDKRALGLIDNTIPYFVLYVQQYSERYQVWLGDKTLTRNGKVKVANYYRTRWMSKGDFVFPINEVTIDKAYQRCVDNISLFRGRSKTLYTATVISFAECCQNMLMTYSYKPLLILALIQNGGCISVENAAEIFRRFYTKRKRLNVKVEKGNCIFADEQASRSALERNIIVNPINALSGCGLFEYDSENKLFYIINELYDELTLKDISYIEKICMDRLNTYFNNL